MSRTVLVVAAHTDDEALGCGGTIARHVAAGDVVHAVFLADGVTSRVGTNKSEFERREAAAKVAQQLLGIRSIDYLGLADNRLDAAALLDIVQPLEAVIQSRRPDIVYTHHSGDLNVDHRVAHKAVLTACRPLPDSTVREIYAFEVMSSTEWAGPGAVPFIPTLHIDISEFLSVKLAALAAYELEMRAPPHSRNFAHVEHLARHRGHSVGVDAAEAFCVVRVVR